MKIAFFGTSQFAANVLQALISSKHSISVVVTKPDQPQGRNLLFKAPPVKKEIERTASHIPIIQPIKCSTEENREILKSFDADIFVVVAYGEILRENILSIPRLGCINVHASLLPKYRGAAPIHRAIINGETQSGICIIEMVRQMDAGDIIHHKSTPITQDMTFQELEQNLCSLGIECLLQALDDFEKGSVKKITQDNNKATIASKIEAAECQINWNNPALVIHNLVRGTYPQPGAWCYVTIKGQKKRLKITKTCIVTEQHVYMPAYAPGLIISQKDRLIIACQDEAIEILRLQPEGKKEMDIQEFLHGTLLNSVTFIV